MLQGAQLMGHTQLSLPGRGFQLSPITVAHPYFRRKIVHDTPDHFCTAIATDHMQHTRQGTKNPFPCIGSIDPVGGFITMNHLALPNKVLDLGDLTERPLSSPFHDLIDPTLADLNLMQVEQCFLSANITHMLLLAVIYYCRFQPTSKPAVHLQSSGWFFNVRRIAFRAGHSILAHFNHLCRCMRQFGDLVHVHQAASLFAQVGMALTT